MQDKNGLARLAKMSRRFLPLCRKCRDESQNRNWSPHEEVTCNCCDEFGSRLPDSILLERRLRSAIDEELSATHMTEVTGCSYNDDIVWWLILLIRACKEYESRFPERYAAMTQKERDEWDNEIQHGHDLHVLWLAGGYDPDPPENC